MKEWNVYINGEYMGTVMAGTEDYARAAAIAKYEVGDHDDLAVNCRAY